MPSKRRSNASRYPSEAQEQEQLVKWLDAKGVTYFAVPNGGLRTLRTAAGLKRQGVKAGVPDMLIIDHPVMEIDGVARTFVGVALELKRQSERPAEPAEDFRDQPFKGASEAQRRWLARFSERGWISLVAYGALDAVLKLVYCNVITLERLEPAERVMLGLADPREAINLLGQDALVDPQGAQDAGHTPHQMEGEAHSEQGSSSPAGQPSGTRQAE
jgi:hypothetical protein